LEGVDLGQGNWLNLVSSEAHYGKNIKKLEGAQKTHT